MFVCLYFLLCLNFFVIKKNDYLKKIMALSRHSISRTLMGPMKMFEIKESPRVKLLKRLKKKFEIPASIDCILKLF